MSRAITTGLTSSSLDASLNEIDHRAKSIARDDHGHVLLGPFGVLCFDVSRNHQDRADPERVSISSSDPNQEQELILTPDLQPRSGSGSEIDLESTTRGRVHTASESEVALANGPEDACSGHCDMNLHASGANEGSGESDNLGVDCSTAYHDSFPSLPDALTWEDIFGLDSGDISQQFAGSLSVLDYSSGHDMASSSAQDFGQVAAMVEQPGQDTRNMPVQNITISTPVPSETIEAVLEQAQTLLAHFRSDVILVLPGQPFSSHSLWEVLHLSEAVSTLANMTFLGASVTEAKKANLFSVLAISAYHRSKTSSSKLSPDGHVSTPSNLFVPAVSEAKRCLQRSLQAETIGPQSAKYKDQLMAILALVTLAVTRKLLPFEIHSLTLCKGDIGKTSGCQGISH